MERKQPSTGRKERPSITKTKITTSLVDGVVHKEERSKSPAYLCRSGDTENHRVFLNGLIAGTNTAASIDGGISMRDEERKQFLVCRDPP